MTERHEREVQRLRDDLDRCRAEQRDELERRGGGGSMDAAERARLLQKVAVAVAAKRKAEEALRSAVDANRQKAAEMRRLHEECRAEVARVSKEANVEIRRLVSNVVVSPCCTQMPNIHAHVLRCNQTNITFCCKCPQLHFYQI